MSLATSELFLKKVIQFSPYRQKLTIHTIITSPYIVQNKTDQIFVDKLFLSPKFNFPSAIDDIQFLISQQQVCKILKGQIFEIKYTPTTRAKYFAQGVKQRKNLQSRGILRLSNTSMVNKDIFQIYHFKFALVIR